MKTIIYPPKSLNAFTKSIGFLSLIFFCFLFFSAFDIHKKKNAHAHFFQKHIEQIKTQISKNINHSKATPFLLNQPTKLDMTCAGTTGGTGDNDDFDGDGICNKDDLDDDNDGIPDLDEKSYCSGSVNPAFSAADRQQFGDWEYLQIDDPSTDGLDSAWYQLPFQTLSDSNSHIYTATYNSLYWNNPSWAYQPSHLLNHAFEIYNSILGTEHYINNHGTFRDVTYNIGDSTTVRFEDQVELYRKVIPPGFDGTYTFQLGGHFTFNSAGDEDAALLVNGMVIQPGFGANYPLRGAGVKMVTTTLESGDTLEFRTRNTTASGGGGTLLLTHVSGCNRFLDTDSDGIPNHLDLDSDGDGCYDFFESGATDSNDSLVTQATAYTSVGSNGLANHLETSADSDTTNYLLRNFVFFNNLNPCLDRDMDGIKDLDDIDDDNDGILDIVESSSCFYNLADITKIDTITSELVTYSTFTTNNAYDNDVSTQSGINNGQNWAGLAVYEIVLNQALQLKQLDIDVGTWGFSGSDTASFRLEGFNGANWIPLSKDTVNQSTTDFSLVNTLDSVNKFNRFRIVGIKGNSYFAGVNEFTLVPFSFNTHDYPKSTCNEDVDMDSIPNHLDLDSDGDGCFDIVEAGIGKPNTMGGDSLVNQLSAYDSVGTNGLANNLETNADSDTVNYTLQPYAYSAALNACADTDGDGVGDLVDIDDDNDGILDIVESPSCFYTESEAVKIDTVTSQLSQLSTSYVATNSYDKNTNTQAALNNSQEWDGKSIYEIVPPTPIQLKQLDIDAGSWSFSLNDTSTFRLEGYNGNTWVPLSKDTFHTTTTNISLINTLDSLSKHQKFRIRGIKGRSSYAGVDEFTLIARDFNGAHYPKSTCNEDVDMDSIPNHLDLDSDGDGCYDMAEAGISNPNTMGGDSLVNQLSAYDSVGTNGLANNLETSADSDTVNYNYQPYAYSATLNACTDTDGDGVRDLVDIDDDNDGILDHHESEKCFFSLKEFSSTGDKRNFVSLSTDLNLTSSNDTLNNLIDGIATNDGIKIPDGQSIVDKSIMRFKFSPAVELSKLYFSYNSNSIFLGTANLKIQGSNDGSTWTDLNTGTNYPQNLPTITLDNVGDLKAQTFQITQNSNDYTYYQIIGVTGNSWSAGELNEIYFESNNYQPSLFQKRQCTADLDMDGKLNHLDLDADGDGCFDSFEAGVTGATNNANALSDSLAANSSSMVGTNGLANQVELTTDTGIIKYTLYPYFLDKDNSLCIDTDKDGIGDLVDIDDDNDGILDTIECPAIPVACGANTVYFGTTTNPLSSETGTPGISPGCNAAGHTCNDDDIFHGSANVNGTTYNYNYQVTRNANDAPCASGSTYDNSAFIGVNYVALGYHNLTLNVDTPSAVVVDYKSLGTASLPVTLHFYVDDVFVGSLTGAEAMGDYCVPRIVHKKLEVRMANADCLWTYLRFGFNDLNDLNITSTACSDTDGDGIINQLDLDSDGDGCYDIYEADVLGVTIDGSFNDSLAIEQSNSAGVGTNGFANYLEISPDTGIYKDTYNYAKAIDGISACPPPLPRFLCVDPINDQIILKNFGGTAIDLTNYRFCSKSNCTTNGLATDLTIVSGSLYLDKGKTVTLTGFSMDDTAADLALYTPTGAYTDTNSMIDFVQWGGAGFGADSVAVKKGIWEAGSYINEGPEYCYTGNGKNENGRPHWDGNDAPIAKNDINATRKGQAVSGQVGLNDADPEGDSVSINPMALNVMNGTVVIDNFGNYTFTPNAGFIGETSFQYEICDNGNPKQCDTAKVNINVLDITKANANNNVIGTADHFTAENDTTLRGNLISNDNDPDGDSIFIHNSPIDSTSNGSLVLNSDGTFIYTPDSNFVGKDYFSYQVCDAGSPMTCDTVEVTMNVLATNNKNDVYATDDASVGKEGKTQNGNVITNDNDPEGDNLSVTITPLSAPQHGTLSLNANGVYSYEPNSGYFGSDQFRYKVCDDGNPQACDSATVYLTVLEKQHPPFILPGVLTIPKDSTGMICLNVTDPNKGSALTASACTGSPESGTANVTMSGNKVCVEYTSDSNFTGTDKVCVIVCDDSGLCDTTNIPVVVVAPLDTTSKPSKPVVIPSPITTPKDSSISVCMPILDANPNDTFSASSCSGSPANGMATTSIDGNQLCVDYTPNSNFTGNDEVCVIVCDQTGLCDTVQIGVKVVPTPASPDSTQAPIVVIPAITVKEDSAGMVCGIIADANPTDTHTVMLCNMPSQGMVQASVNNASSEICLDYTPNKDFAGKDSICMIVCDQTGLCDTTMIAVNVLPVNDAPEAMADSVTVGEDSLIVINVQKNDTDTEGDSLITNVIGTSKQGGQVMVLNGDSIKYEPPTDYNGNDTIQYEICDNGAPKLCDTAEIIIRVEPINDAPVANPDTVTTGEDSTLVVNVQKNDSDVDGDSLTTSVIGTSTQGVMAMVLAEDSIKYTPPTDFNGNDTIKYQICDNGMPQLCDTSEIIIMVEPRNDAPVAMPDTVETAEDSTLVVDVQKNDIDVEGDSLTTTVIGTSTQGVMAMVLAGDSIKYTPPMDFNGKDTIKYQICDNGTPQLCDTSEIILTVNPKNDAPVANPDTVMTGEDSTLIVDVQKNDIDVEGDSLTTTIIGPSTQGVVVTVLAGDSIEYMPPMDFNGNDTIKYQVCDNGIPQLCDTAEIIIMVAPRNDAPIAMLDRVETAEDSTLVINVQNNDTDIDGDSLTTSVIGSSTQGVMAMIVGDSIKYSPPMDYNGNDTIKYQVCDNGMPQLCDTSEVIITVHPRNDVPVAMPDMVTTGEDSTLVVAVQQNDTDVDGDSLTTSVIGTSTQGVTAMLVGDSVQYMPPKDYNGTDTIKYQICDNGTPQLCDTSEIIIMVTPINDAPIANIDTVDVIEDSTVIIAVQKNDIDVDGDSLTTSVVGVSTQGVMAMIVGDSIKYTPPMDYNGNDTIRYQVCDNGMPQLCDTAEIIIMVQPQNDAPVANPDNAMLIEDSMLVVKVQMNDTDVEGDSLITSVIGTSTQGVQVTVLHGDSINYMPPANFNGIDTVKYQICDDGVPQLCDTSEIVITVNPKNDVPVANPDAVTTAEDSTFVINVQQNDTDIDGDSLITSLIGPSTQGIMAMVLNGDSIVYTPPMDYNGSDTLQYQICDNGTPQLCDTSEIIITVEARNDVPVAMPDTVTTAEDSTFVIDVQKNDLDIDGDSLITNVIGVSTQGVSVTVVNGDSLIYSPPMDFNGNDTIKYEVCDSGTPTLCDTSEIIVKVEPRNDVPVAMPDTVTTAEDSTFVIDVQKNDLDIDGDSLITNVIGVSTQGVNVTVVDGDSLIYTPPVNFYGMDTIKYEVCDNGSPTLCDTAEIIITVEARNDAPEATPDTVKTAEDNLIVVDVQINDKDVEGDSLTTSIISTSASGSVVTVINGDSVSYLPPADFNGTDTIRYAVCDSGSPTLCDTSEIIIEVAPINDKPVAVTDPITIPEDTPLVVDVQANDKDVDGDSLTTSVLGSIRPGSIIMVTTDGQVSYIPPLDYNGEDTIRYEICDNGSPTLCDTSEIVLTIVPVNDALKAIDDINTTGVNKSVGGNVLINDADVEQDSFYVDTAPINVKHGSVTIDEEGNYAFIPNPDFSGEASFQYRVCDKGILTLCDTATVVIDVIDVTDPNNLPIIGVEDNFVMELGGKLSGSLTSNDHDPDGVDILIDTTAISQPANGTLMINPDGTFTYTPSPYYFGKDEFSYRVCDSGNPVSCDTVNVSVEVLANDYMNDIYATDDALIGVENKPKSGNLLLNDFDPENDTKIVNQKVVKAPVNGVVSIDASGVYTYTPKLGFLGNDQFVYEVCDDGNPVACDTASTYITIVELNEIFATNDINQTFANKPVSGKVTINDRDPEGDSMFVNTVALKNVENGVLTLHADGTYDYTPNKGFVGVDYFEYKICDNGQPSACDSAKVKIIIQDALDPTVNEVIGQADNITSNLNSKISGCLTCNDFDPEGDEIIVDTNPVTYPNNGSVIIDSNGMFIYIPDSNFVGIDTFVYRICDDEQPAACVETEVTITVLADDGSNRTFATDDANYVEEGKSLIGNVLSNDHDSEGDRQAIQTTPLVAPQNGRLTLNADGSYEYIPNIGYLGTDQFVYEVCDDNGKQACDKATVYISILLPNVKPLIHDPCHCLDNEDAPGTGQFSEKISILSVKNDEVWTMIENTGFYGVNTPVPSQATYLVPTGTVAKAADKFNGYYQYVLDGVHVDGVGYNSKFTNGKDTVLIKNTCYYDESCRKSIVTNPDGTPGVLDSCALNLIMGTNGTPRIDSLKCCDSKTTFADDGTVDGLYKDSQPRDDRFTICPQNQWQTLKYNFTEFGLGKGDVLYVYEGRDILGTELGRFEGEGVSQTGGWVASSCAPSVNSNGCLTFRLITNGDNNKSIGWNGNFECEDREIELFPPNNLNAQLSCTAVSTLFEIKPATVKAGCGEVKDSQIIRIFNQHGDLCLDTCLAPTEVLNERFGVGSYLIKYLLKTDTVKSAEAVLTVQGTNLVCNDVLNVPLGAGCSVMLTPDDILEGGCDTIVDTAYYYITLLGTDKNGKETVLASGGGKAGNYPMVTKEMLKTCKGQIKARIEKRYYEGLNLNFCNNGIYKEQCESVVNILDQTAPVFTNALQSDTFKLCSYDLTEAGLAGLKPTAVDACGTATVTLEGSKILNQGSEVCDTTRVEVTWKATDDCNNSQLGTQLLVFVRPSLTDLVKAKEVVVSCEGDKIEQLTKVTERPGIKVGKIKNGQLIATDTLILSETDYTCGYILQKRDVEVATDCNTKLFRYWDVLDWCDTEAGVIAIDTQLIEWKDTLAPVFEKTYLTTRKIALPFDTCTIDISDLERPKANDNCSTPIVKMNSIARIENGAKIKIANEEITRLEADSFEVEWVATDACQSLKGDTIQQILIIEDHTKPTAICRDKLHLSLGNGSVEVHYREFDKGSSDACGILKYEVSRDEVNWDSTVTFDCEDVHKEIDVYLRVTDTNGNENSCWAKVLVEDKVAPICTDLPTITEDCESFHIGKRLAVTDINANHKMDDTEWVALTASEMLDFNKNYGNPNCSDNLTCTELVIEQEYQLINKTCGSAEIRRRYRARDWDGKGQVSNWSEQLIIIETKPNWSIILPADWEGACGEAIPASSLKITNGACDLMGYEVEEKTFTTVEDACLKVVRTFTIINGCDANTGNTPIRIAREENHHGIVKSAQEINAADFAKGVRLEYVQVLKIKDETAPAIIINEVDNCLTGETCNDTKVFSISATDCNEVATAHLNYSWQLLADDVEISKGVDSTFEAVVLPNKAYEVTWTVSDNCGNTSRKSQTYIFTDCKKPSPYCLHGIAVDLIEDKGEVLVWASDIERGSADNCSDAEKLEYRIWHASLGVAPTDGVGVEALPKSIRFTCAYLGNQDVYLYAIDGAGNWDYCKTYVNVQDNTNACENTGNQSIAMVSGYIADWKDRMVEQVEVRATSTKMMATQEDGYYELELNTGADYQLVPEKLINPLNGVSTFDLVLITKHILGKELFENPYQQIAADANRSGSITAFDLVQLRKLILNIDQDFQNNASWRFVAADYEFKSSNPLTESFPEEVLLKNVLKERKQDFVAIKIGDVNGNARANSLVKAEPRTSTKKLQLFVSEQDLKAGEDYKIIFKTTQLQRIQGYQFTMHLGEVTLNKIAPGIVGADKFGMRQIEQGLLTTSWNRSIDATSQFIADEAIINAEKEELFALDIHANQNGKLSESLQLISRPTAIEAYDMEGNIMEVELVFEEVISNQEFELYQNEPNPFYSQTNIGFYLPGDSEIELTLRDAKGRLLRRITQTGKAGYNSIQLEKEDLTTGFIYYQLSTKYGTKAKKMLQLR